MNAIRSVLSSNVSGLVTPALGAQKAVAGVVDGVGDAASAVVSLSAQGLERLQRDAVGLVDGLVDGASAVIDGVQSAGAAVVDVLEDGGNAVYAVADGLADGLGDAASAVVDGMASTASQLATYAALGLSAAAKAIDEVV